MKKSLPPSSYTSLPLKKFSPFPVMEDDSEISIFEAHNYFNQHDQPPVAPLAASPVSSEAAWNGRKEHQGNSPMTIRVNMRGIASKKRNVSGWKWFFGMICGGKKAVEIKEKVSDLNHHNLAGSDPKRQTKRLTVNHPIHKVSQKSVKGLNSRDSAKRSGLIRTSPKFPPEFCFPTTQSGFSFPILGRPPPEKFLFTSSSVRYPIPIPIPEPPRVSLEIFRPSDGSITPPHKSGGAAMDDGDVESDTSSDLFEIESFMTQTTTVTAANDYHSFDEACRRFGYFRRNLDESATAAAAEGYEPSEASIEWSVTTAEGFDHGGGSVTNFSASASDIVDDVTLMRLELQRLGSVGFGGGGDDGCGRRRGNRLLMRCQWGVGHPVKKGDENCSRAYPCTHEKYQGISYYTQLISSKERP